MSPRLTQLLLALGALSGVSLAAVDLWRMPARDGLPEDAVALVDGRPIRRADYSSALAAVSADRREGAADPALRRHVLDRLIDEELLVQAALELGLAERDRRVRADLGLAAIAFVTEAPLVEPTETELARFYDEHRDYFAPDPRFELEQLFFRGVAARERALDARARWVSGAAPETKGDAPPLPLPNGPLSLPKLEQYLGPAAARAVATLGPGGVSDALPASDGYHLLRVVSRQGGTPPPFAEARAAVLAEWRRRESERLLRDFLDSRRKRARVVVATELGS